ncbi:hypothetical protein Stsp01_54330 [Streptomyces sp. NBRC 13847]|nr:hypothetical protein Stsp01_54330 [Streptomyces sp. NBRC 13847]
MSACGAAASGIRHPASGIRHTIPETTGSQAARLRNRSRGGRPPGFDEERYKKRNTIERALNRLKQHRAVATRYDKHPLRPPRDRHRRSPHRLAPNMIARTSPRRCSQSHGSQSCWQARVTMAW